MRYEARATGSRNVLTGTVSESVGARNKVARKNHAIKCPSFLRIERETE